MLERLKDEVVWWGIIVVGDSDSTGETLNRGGFGLGRLVKCARTGYTAFAAKPLILQASIHLRKRAIQRVLIEGITTTGMGGTGRGCCGERRDAIRMSRRSTSRLWNSDGALVMLLTEFSPYRLDCSENNDMIIC